ncbi:MAG: tRNA-intron endonuclease family protein [Candidatus Micrarchaeota archaeon]
MEEIEFTNDFLILRNKSLILKLRSLGAGIEEREETKITYLEAAYFADRKVLPIDKEKLLEHAGKQDKLSKEKYTVIKYLRDRGYIVRPSLDGTPYLRLHRKGYRPGEDKTYYLIHVVQKDWKASMENLILPLEAASRLRKELAIAVVDGEEPRFLKFARLNFD